MSILAKMGDWQVRGFALAGAEVGGGGRGRGPGGGRRRGRALALGRRVVSEARLAAPRRVPRRERAEKTRAAGGPGAEQSPAHAPQVAPGVTCGLCCGL